VNGRRSLAAVLGLIVLMAAAPLARVYASSPDPQMVTVPTAGNSVTLNWSGSLVPSSHANSTCATVPSDPTVDHQHITVTVPGGLYATSTAQFVFSITWTPASGNENANDEILTLVGPSGSEIASSDTSNTTEAVTQPNLAGGIYDVEACGFANSTPQPYTGKLVITTALNPPPTPIPSPAAPHANPITFGVPSVMDPIHPFGEPDIGVDNLGRTFVSGPAGTGTQRSLWESSVDGGHTYRIISPGPPPNAVAGSNAGGPGGGDTEIVFDNGTKAGHATQGQYFADLYALTCFRVAATFDGGNTVAQNNYPGGCAGNPPTADRQWMAVYDPPTGVTTTSAYGLAHPGKSLVYLEYNGGGAFWTKSTDGTTYTTADGGVSHFGTNAYVAIDQVTGKVFEATFSGAAMKMNIGTPSVSGTGDLCFLDQAATVTPPCPAGSGLVTVASNPTSGNGGLFVVMSMDSARNLYVGWVGAGNQTFVAAAPPDDTRPSSACTNCWTNWTAPVQVSDGLAVTGDQINVFPWIKAGSGGRADMVWYGDSSNLSPNSTAPGHVWNVFMSQLIFPTDAMGHITGASPDNQLVKVSPHPMDYLDICLSGLGCATNTTPGNRNLADFFQVNIDATGAAEVVYDDMSNGVIQQPQTCASGLASTPADHCGAALVMVVRQNAGMGLNGTLVTGPSAAPVTGMKDASGDALYTVIQGTNLPAMDLTESDLSLAGNTLTVTMKVADLTQIPGAATATGGLLQEYLTRWQMGNTLYYAEAYATGNLVSFQFSAGTTQSIDLCSVSLCDPHVMLYPEADQVGAANIESGSATCPTSPSATNPCTITINVNTAHVGSPTSTSFLESVGAYAYSASHFQTGTTTLEAQADSVPLEIDGVCCYNFGTAPGPGNNIPEFPWAPFAIVAALTSIGSGALIRRRASRRGVAG
jgi:hypothetical protein